MPRRKQQIDNAKFLVGASARFALLWSYGSGGLSANNRAVSGRALI
jgi:hypothetical protein